MTTRRSLLGAALAAIALAACQPAAAGSQTVDGAEARRLVAAGATLLDVRTPEEFQGEHLPGAINIPVQDLEGRTGELGAKDKPVVVYCRSGSRSARAASILTAGGFKNVRDLGPMSAW